MNIKVFAAKVTEISRTVRAECKSIEQGAALMVKTGQRSIEDAIYEESRRRAIRSLRAA